MAMKKILFLLLASGLFLIQSCAPAVRIVSDADENGQFQSYKTYNFLPFSEGNQKTVTGMELERLRVAFAQEIEKRGLQFAEKDADISVQLTVYHREAGGRYYYRPYGYSYIERAIAVDFYENLSRRHVWHAAAVGELQRDPQKRKENFKEVAAALFEQYPVPMEMAEGS